MAKLHHAELKDLQNERSAKGARRVFRQLAKGKHPKRASGQPLTGVDITYLACFRMTQVRA